MIYNKKIPNAESWQTNVGEVNTLNSPFIMSTKQSYVGKGNYATPSNQTFSGHTYRTQTFLLVVDIARLSGEPESQIWKRIYQLIHAFYGVYLPGLPRRRQESLLRVAERHDLLDKVYSVAYAERLGYQSIM